VRYIEVGGAYCAGEEIPMFDKRRRDFIILLAAAAWPLAARAQQAGVRRIGVLMAYAESNLEGQANVAAFREGLQKLG
jgi:putative tryptophan/tyrosine transport system substrate-binding protein